jgi:hypothetical protein
MEDRPTTLLRYHQAIMRTADRLKARGHDREDMISAGWVSVLARGDTSGLLRMMRESRRYARRRGMTNRVDKLSPGVREYPSQRDAAGKEWLAGNAGGWGVVLPPRKAAGDYEPTGRPPGRPPKRAPNGASAPVAQGCWDLKHPGNCGGSRARPGRLGGGRILGYVQTTEVSGGAA